MNRLSIGAAVGFCLIAGWAVRGDDLPAVHPDCPYFGPQRERLAGRSLSAPTERVSRMLAAARGIPVDPVVRSHDLGLIDSYIFADLRAHGISPAPPSTDWEFIRRVTLELTGRIPKPDRVLAFAASTAPNKRAGLVEELLASSEWTDKWTMYFGDLFQNTVSKPSTGLQRFPEGRNAFYQWIKDSLAQGKPYNQMAAELISAAGDNSYQDGRLNWLVGGVVTGGPAQDIMDQMTANVADVFLGVAHVNCLLCHNGRGHLDNLSLWAVQTTRYQAWQLASFLSHTQAARHAASSVSTNVYSWSLLDDVKGYTTDYALNTTTGNRPPRVAAAGCKSGQPCWYVKPAYSFNGDTPKNGETYRQSLARYVTGDFQFARAAVNYIWAQFFGRGIVDPPDTFDPARLDPDKPPPAPWTLQPTNARLLNALAESFVQSGYDLRALMREIADSEAYQLSSRYPGQWNAAWEPYFARKFVRRLWAEEIHDAVAQSSGLLPSYSITGFTNLGFAKVSYAMQFPDVVNAPTGDGNASALLDGFLRGNRDNQPRSGDGSILQALNLMNNPFVEARIQATGAKAAPLIADNLKKSDAELVNAFYLNVLSRYPTPDEAAKSLAALAKGNRIQAAQDLLWALYNKVDFVFNY